MEVLKERIDAHSYCAECMKRARNAISEFVCVDVVVRKFEGCCFRNGRWTLGCLKKVKERTERRAFLKWSTLDHVTATARAANEEAGMEESEVRLEVPVFPKCGEGQTALFAHA